MFLCIAYHIFFFVFMQFFCSSPSIGSGRKGKQRKGRNKQREQNECVVQGVRILLCILTFCIFVVQSVEITELNRKSLFLSGMYFTTLELKLIIYLENWLFSLLQLNPSFIVFIKFLLANREKFFLAPILTVRSFSSREKRKGFFPKPGLRNINR